MFTNSSLQSNLEGFINTGSLQGFFRLCLRKHALGGEWWRVNVDVNSVNVEMVCLPGCLRSRKFTNEIIYLIHDIMMALATMMKMLNPTHFPPSLTGIVPVISKWLWCGRGGYFANKSKQQRATSVKYICNLLLYLLFYYANVSFGLNIFRKKLRG